MKLAEALIERKDLKTRITELQGRVGTNATVSEGETPEEDPNVLFKQVGDLVQELGVIIKRINNTNNTATLETGQTITDAIVTRDMLKMRQTQVTYAIQQSQVTRNRYSRDEVKTIGLMDVNELRKLQDSLSKEYRELDTLIQAANWGSDLV